MRTVMPRTLASAFALVLLLAGANAHATLTPSELAQIRDAVTSAKPGVSPGRIRALVARPDLTDEEAATALAQAIVPVPFTPARGTMLKDVIFGGASVASRPLLATAVTKSLITRAESVLSRTNLDSDTDAQAELLRIYAFLTREIADAPGRRGLGRDPQNGISLTAYDDCAHALSQHLERNPKWLRDEAKLSAGVARVRAQFKLALLGMMNESPTMRVEAADRLALTGARRSFFTELGILVLDNGIADDARIDRIRAVISRLPGVREGTSAIYFGESKPDLVARGAILAIGGSLEAGTAKGAVASSARENVFPDEVEPSAFDPATVDLARELSNVVVTRALARRGELKLRAERDVRACEGDAARLLGKAEFKPESALASAVTLLLLDGARTIELAMVRFLAGRPESAAFLSDAIGVLAAHNATGDGRSGLQVALGRPREDGSTDSLWASQVELGSDGGARSFVLHGLKWELIRGESGAITEARRNGQSVTLAVLPAARLPVREAADWRAGGLVFTKLSGSPKAAVAAGGRVRLVGANERNFDAIATPAPAPDVAVETELKVFGAPGGLLVRAAPAQSGIRGVGLFVDPNPKAGTMRLGIRALLDSGSGADVAPAQDARYAPSMKVKLTVRGNKIEVVAGGTTLRGTLPPGLATGDVALQADRGANVEAIGLAIKKL
jgi:hypothetical protein